jgi:hypothetical protein
MFPEFLRILLLVRRKLRMTLADQMFEIMGTDAILVELNKEILYFIFRTFGFN